MGRVAVITDSTCCLPSELVEKYDICVVPLVIIHKGNSYYDGIDISPGEVYKIMRRRKEMPTTSTPSAGDFLNAYRKLSESADGIVCITLTGLQSKTYEAAAMAREKAGEAIPDAPIEVVDSRAVAGALGFVALEAARAAGKGAALAEVVATAQAMIPRVNHLAMLDTLYYLARTGRVARAAAWAGSVLNMKPIVEHSTQVGETTPVARPRTTAKAVERILGLMAERVAGRPVHVIVHHADEPEEGEKLRATIESRFDCSELYLTEFSPGMGVHAGPGVLAVSFYAD
jgi:DegV family protein with EDD domain